MTSPPSSSDPGPAFDPAHPDWCPRDSGCVLPAGHSGDCDLTAAAYYGLDPIRPSSSDETAQFMLDGDALDQRLTFAELQRVSVLRCLRWHGPDTEPWSGADWSNAMCGEAGEAANVVKKLRRLETRTGAQNQPAEAKLREMLGEELADVVCYVVLVAAYYGLDLGAAVIGKFNAVSEREQFPERLDGSDGEHYWRDRIADEIAASRAKHAHDVGASPGVSDFDIGYAGAERVAREGNQHG